MKNPLTPAGIGVLTIHKIHFVYIYIYLYMCMCVCVCVCCVFFGVDNKEAVRVWNVKK